MWIYWKYDPNRFAVQHLFAARRGEEWKGRSAIRLLRMTAAWKRNVKHDRSKPNGEARLANFMDIVMDVCLRLGRWYREINVLLHRLYNMIITRQHNHTHTHDLIWLANPRERLTNMYLSALCLFTLHLYKKNVYISSFMKLFHFFLLFCLNCCMSCCCWTIVCVCGVCAGFRLFHFFLQFFLLLSA